MNYIKLFGVGTATRFLQLSSAMTVLQAENGLIALGLHIQGNAQKNAPRLTGNLKASAFTIAQRMSIGKISTKRKQKAIPASFPSVYGKTKHAVEAEARVTNAARAEALLRGQRSSAVVVGFGAEYALPVHESIGQNFTEGGAKFLEKAASAAPSVAARIFRAQMNKGTP